MVGLSFIGDELSLGSLGVLGDFFFLVLVGVGSGV